MLWQRAGATAGDVMQLLHGTSVVFWFGLGFFLSGCRDVFALSDRLLRLISTAPDLCHLNGDSVSVVKKKHFMLKGQKVSQRLRLVPVNAQLRADKPKPKRETLSRISLYFQFPYELCTSIEGFASQSHLRQPRNVCLRRHLVSGCYMFVKVTAKLGEHMSHSRSRPPALFTCAAQHSEEKWRVYQLKEFKRK